MWLEPHRKQRPLGEEIQRALLVLIGNWEEEVANPYRGRWEEECAARSMI